MIRYKDVKTKMIELFRVASERFPVHSTVDEDFIIYRGYRISKTRESDYVVLVDARNGDYYRPVDDDDLRLFLKVGFEHFCDKKQVIRDSKRIISLSDRIRECIEKDTDRDSLMKERGEIIKRINKLTKKHIDNVHH